MNGFFRYQVTEHNNFKIDYTGYVVKTKTCCIPIGNLKSPLNEYIILAFFKSRSCLYEILVVLMVRYQPLTIVGRSIVPTACVARRKVK